MSTDPSLLRFPNIPRGSGGEKPPAAEASLTLAQWFSPGFPVGAFAYSHGLETAITEGAVTGAATLGDWIAAVLDHGAGRNDAVLIAAAYQLSPAVPGMIRDLDGEGRGAARIEAPGQARGGVHSLADLDALARALAPSAERLTETSAQGAAFARTTNGVWRLDLPDLTYPVAVGAASGRLALPLPDTLRLYLLALAANLVSAGVRLIPLGQTQGQQVLAALAPLAARIAAEAEPGDLEALGGAALAADIQSMRHETQTVRIFRT